MQVGSVESKLKGCSGDHKLFVTLVLILGYNTYILSTFSVFLRWMGELFFSLCLSVLFSAHLLVLLLKACISRTMSIVSVGHKSLRIVNTLFFFFFF